MLHALQAVAVLLLARRFAITVTSSFPAGPPVAPVPAPEPLVDVGVGAAIAVFLGLAVLDHLLTATLLRRRYEEDLRRGINCLRWLECSLSSTVMVLLICAYTGITGVTALIGIAGAAPWVAVTANIVGAAQPGFVYGIFVSLFVFFMRFAVNQWLQYRRIGPWRSYDYGQKSYLVLSLVAKSLIAPSPGSPSCPSGRVPREVPACPSDIDSSSVRHRQRQGLWTG